jgi:hypothetical protein
MSENDPSSADPFGQIADEFLEAFSARLKGCDGECPCCRRRFADAG